MESKTFKVPNIGCDGCVRSVENEVKQITGVQRVESAADSKMVTVEWVDPASWQQIVDALTEIDYPPVLA